MKELHRKIDEALRLFEDSLPDAVASKQFASMMLNRALMRRRKSASYWRERLKSAEERINLLKQKGKRLTGGTIKSAAKILDNALNPQKIPLKETSKKLGKQFVKEFKTEYGFSFRFKHITDRLKDFGKATGLLAKSFIENPPKELGKLGQKIKTYFKEQKLALKTVVDIAKNGKVLASEYAQKKKTKFTKEELDLLKKDPDSAFEKLTSGITDEEQKRVEKLIDHSARAGMIVALGATAIAAAPIFMASAPTVTGNITASALSLGGLKIADDLKRAGKFAVINTVAYAATGKSVNEDIEEDEMYGLMALQAQPFIEVWQKPANMKILIKAIEEVSNAK